MPYRLRYTVSIDWIGAGAGPMEAELPSAGQMLQGGGASGQSKTFVTNPATIPTVLGTGAGTFPATQLASGDITTLLTALTTDISAQMNANIGTMQGWASGQP
jgi:hypothetical protein